MKTKHSMIIITSIVCILPVFYGLLVYSNLPDKIGIPVFGLDSEGIYNMHFHKAYPAFGMPLLILAVNIISKIIIYKNPKYNDESKAMRIIMDWICPVMSLIAVPLWLFRAMGAEIPIEMILYIWMIGGVVYIIAGFLLNKDFATRLTITVITIFILTTVPILYSYLVYVKEKKFV